MTRISNINHSLLLTLLFILLSVCAYSQNISVADLEGEDKVRFDKFRKYFSSSNSEEFYKYASDYEIYLRKRNNMMLYYKLKGNKGFYALRHGQIFRAMRFAEELDDELRKAGAADYYYLSTGLMGDIYYQSHDTRKAEQYFRQSLIEVGDRDPKFTMRIYLSLAEMLSLKVSGDALQWIDKSLSMARKKENNEYLSMSIAMKAYIYFLQGNAKAFYKYYEEYESMRSKEIEGFSHRYDNMMQTAKASFDGDYAGAIALAREGRLYVDSSLVVIRIYAMEGNVDQGFSAMRSRYIEMDSVYSLAQDANFDDMAMERSLMRSQQEVIANKKLVKKLTNWLIGMTVVFLFIYIMGRRRLMIKIWARNKELNDALTHAEESDRMKSAFISNMSHEIRTPLNAVAGFSQILCSADYELSEEERTDMQERITSNVELITAIVGELLELSKSESEGPKPREAMKDVRPNELCRSLLKSTVSSAKSTVETRFATKVDDQFTLRTDGPTVQRILTHLLNNAQKFTDEGHIILSCSLSKSGHHLILSVSDTGIGIPASESERIFENFAKVDDFKSGVGLGLPISRKLATSIGAELTLDTHYTQGSRFVLSVPV